MYYNRPYFEALFKAVRLKLLSLTENKLDILSKDGSLTSAALGNNIKARELIQQIEARRKQKPANLLEYKEDFKAVHYINLHPEVAALAAKHKRTYFDYGRRLYTKMKQLIDEPDLEGVEINDTVEVNALLNFIGFTSESAFCLEKDVMPPSQAKPRRRYTPRVQETVSIKPVEIANEAATKVFSFQVEEGFHYFLLCYYSKRSDRVNKALLAIANDGTGGPWEARQYGFHQAGEEDFASIPFHGDAKIYGRRLYINLQSGSDLTYQPMQMNIIGLLEDVVAKRIKQKPIHCSLMTASIHGQYTISTEGYMLPCTLEEARSILDNPTKLTGIGIPLETGDGKRFSKEELDNLSLYLTMSRKHFHLELDSDGETMTDLKNLAIRKVPVSKFTTRLRGTWRLWNFGLQRSAIIESKLVIEDDFRARFYPYIDIKVQRAGARDMLNQLATISISNEIRNEQFCVTTYSPKGDLMNMTCFDFDGLQEDDIADGIFLSVGYDRPNSNNHYKSSGPIGGYVVMRKLQDNEADFTPQKIEPKNVEKHLKDLGLEYMLQRLRVLWKRKTQKKLVNLRMGAFAVCTHPEKGLLVIKNEEEPYTARFHLPGGMLKEHGKTLDEILEEAILMQTGLDSGFLTLWQNATDILTINHKQDVKETIHLVGALYKGECADISPGQRAFFLNPAGMDREKFTPFAWLAVQEYLGRTGDL